MEGIKNLPLKTLEILNYEIKDWPHGETGRHDRFKPCWTGRFVTVRIRMRLRKKVYFKTSRRGEIGRNELDLGSSTD